MRISDRTVGKKQKAKTSAAVFPLLLKREDSVQMILIFPYRETFLISASPLGML